MFLIARVSLGSLNHSPCLSTDLLLSYPAIDKAGPGEGPGWISRVPKPPEILCASSHGCPALTRLSKEPVSPNKQLAETLCREGCRVTGRMSVIVTLVAIVPLTEGKVTGLQHTAAPALSLSDLTSAQKSRETPRPSAHPYILRFGPCTHVKGTPVLMGAGCCTAWDSCCPSTFAFFCFHPHECWTGDMALGTGGHSVHRNGLCW